MSRVEIIAVEKLPLIKKGDDIAKLVVKALKNQNMPLKEKDILVVTHVAVSKAEGNIVDLEEVAPSKKAKEIAEQTGKDPRLVEVILQETKEIVRLSHKCIISETKLGIVCANAGVDRSNVGGGRLVALLPKNPDLSAQKIQRDIKRLTGYDVAVIICDTHGRPLRNGQINVAIGIGGIRPLRDRRGETDLIGYVLTAKNNAVADELTAAAGLVIGHGNEGIPAAIIRGYKYFVDKNASASELTRPKEKDLFR